VIRLPRFPYPPKLPVLGHLHQIAVGRLSQLIQKTGVEHPEGQFSVWLGDREWQLSQAKVAGEK
jgi:hypothetical protein